MAWTLRTPCLNIRHIIKEGRMDIQTVNLFSNCEARAEDLGLVLEAETEAFVVTSIDAETTWLVSKSIYEVLGFLKGVGSERDEMKRIAREKAHKGR
jgi:hypothetical protein